MNSQANRYYDVRGLELTASSQDAVFAYDNCIEQLFEYRISTMKQLKVVLEIDRTMPMSLCLQGYLFLMIGSNAVKDRVLSALTQLREESNRLNPREMLHLAALEDWYIGDDVRACEKWYEILCQFPLDILAVRLLHSSAFWMGNSALLHDCTGSVFTAWDQSHPGYGYLLGMHAFALEESGQYERAERLGLEAIEMNKDDLWALHAVAHVYEMQSRLKEGSTLLNIPRDSLDDRNPFRGHIWWHAAMFALDSGQYDQVLSIYDDCIRSIESTFYLDVQNTASLLTRLDLRGVDVGNRWEELADIAEQQIDDHVLAFTEMHYAMSLAADHRQSAIQAHLDSLKVFAESKNRWSASVMSKIGIKLCKAVVEHRKGDYEAFIRKVLPIRHHLSEVGGSHAQRDIFDQLLLDSAIKSNQLFLARSLSSERLSSRPDNPDNWQWYGEVSDLLGNKDQAENAFRKAKTLLI